MSAATIALHLPPAFITDCIESDCDVGEYVHRTGILTANAEQLAELRSRASHYATGGTDMAPSGLIRSARATLERLDRHRNYFADRAAFLDAELCAIREKLAFLTTPTGAPK